MTPEYRRTFVGEGVNTQQQGNDTLLCAVQPNRIFSGRTSPNDQPRGVCLAERALKRTNERGKLDLFLGSEISLRTWTQVAPREQGHQGP